MTPQELKNSILQLAIQGKLVEHRPEEGTAEELYREIQEEKRRLIKEGKIKKEKPLPEITENEVPFEIPKSWKWVRLGEIGQTNIGLTYAPKDIAKTGIIVLRSNNIQQGKMNYADVVRVEMNVPDNKLCHKGDILICARNGSKRLVGKSAIIDCDGMSFGAFMAIFRSAYNGYILYVINSIFFRNSLLHDTGTTTINQITQEMLKEAIVPFPPLGEQKRIVSKIEELLPYIDRYKQAWNRLEEFNKCFPMDMQKSLLQIAIQGNLVEHRPEEGTAEELYQQIQAEKRRLIKEGKIKKEKPLPEITEDEKPFEIPKNWRWIRLSDLCKSIIDGDHQPPPQVPNGIPFLVISNVSSGIIDFSNTRFVASSYFNTLSTERLAEPGDLLFTVTGSYGIPIKVKCQQSFCFQRHIALLKLLINWDYIYYVLKSPCVQSYCDKVATGTAQKTVGLKSLRKMVIPLPPLAEQKRIVTRLDGLLPLCERLK